MIIILFSSYIIHKAAQVNNFYISRNLRRCASHIKTTYYKFMVCPILVIQMLTFENLNTFKGMQLDYS